MARRTASAKKTAAKKTTAAKKNNNLRVKAKANDAQVCSHPTTLFEVEFPTTLLFWAGVALFFFLLLVIAATVLG